MAPFYKQALGALLLFLAGLLPARAQIVLDGRIQAGEIGAGTGFYQSIGQYTNPHGFGDWGLKEAFVACDGTFLYIALAGTVENNGNSLQMYLNTPASVGQPMGIPLPPVFSAAGDPTSFQAMTATMEMETDLGIAWRYNAGVPQVELADYRLGTPASQALGPANDTGTLVTYLAGVLQVAYLTSPDGTLLSNTNEGLELRIALAALAVQPGDPLQLFVLMNNIDGGYLSTDFIPQDPTGGAGNLGPAPDFLVDVPGVQAAPWAACSACTLAAPQLTTNAPLCAGQTLTLTATGVSAGATYAWTGPNGFTSNAAAPTLPNATAAASGTYTLVISQNGCSAAAITSATVTALPTAPTAMPAGRCGPDTVTLIASGAPTGGTYRWYQMATGGTYIFTGAAYTTPNLIATTTYYVTCVSANGCESLPPRTAATASISVAPIVTVTASGATTFCQGGSVMLTAAAGPTATYRWSSGQLTPAITVTQAGVYTVLVTAGVGCTTTSTPVVVTVNPAASAAFAYAAGSYCLNGANPVPLITGTPGGTFTAAPTTGLSLDPATGALSLAASQAGTYTVTYAVAGLCPAQATATVTLTAAPATPTFSVQQQSDGTVVLVSSAVTGNQWYLNGARLAGATSPTYTVAAAAQSGAYTVVVTAGGCASVPSPGQVITVTGLDGLLPATSLHLYPNPTPDGRLTLSLTALTAATPLTLLDATGRAVWQALLPAGTTRYDLDVRTLPAGIYTLRAGATVRRLVRE